MTRDHFSEVLLVESLSADLLTPVSVFLRVAENETHAFLFESVEGGSQIARYSYIGVCPDETLFIEDGILNHRNQSGIINRIEGNPFDGISNFFEKCKQPRISTDTNLPPFSGGAVGYIGYETVRYLEQIDRAKEAGVPTFEAYLMIFRTIIAFDHVSKELKIISKHGHEISKIREKLNSPSPREIPIPSSSTSKSEVSIEETTPVLGKKRFIEAVNRIKEHIQKGDVFQCVISEQFSLDLRVSPFELYRSLRGTSPSPYLFFLKMGREVLLGASPEMLLKAQDGKVETFPIAGTRSRGQTQLADERLEQELRESVKEKAEHLMLVDLGRNDIGKIALPGSVRVNEFMKVERYSHVMHLVSHVEGRLDPTKSVWKAFTSCFPAGTLTGAPKIRAMQLISELELRCRGAYGGAVIYYDFSGKFDSCIVIRSVYCRDGKAYLQAGAGIVADSSPEEEYQEVLRKTQSVRRALALAQGGKRKEGKEI